MSWVNLCKRILSGASCLAFVIILTSCGEPEEAPKAPPVIPATVITIELQDILVAFEYVGQAESSRQVEIRARVDGFLEKQTYQDGALVQAKQVLFELDKKDLIDNIDIGGAALYMEGALKADVNLYI